MAQAPRTLTPHASGWHFLGAELRCWRQRSGMSLAQLARVVYASPDLLAKIEKADRAASFEVIGRCDDALNTGGALARLWRFVEQHSAPREAAQSPSTSPIVVRIVTEVIASGIVEHEAGAMRASGGGARLYALPGGKVP
jgi:hypothetical protein